MFSGYDRLGVVLAAGRSSRLGNKTLLPARDGKIVVESAVDFLRRSATDAVSMVVNPTGIHQAVLKTRATPIDHFVVQTSSTGVLQAAALCAPLLKEGGHAVIAFGDNIYPNGWAASVWIGDPGASVVSRPNSLDLDYYDDDNKWKSRKECSSSSHSTTMLAFAGYCILAKKHLEMVDENTLLIPFFNDIEVRPIRYDRPGWHDVGTPKSYRTYL